MQPKTVFSICGMCTVRCPIQAELDDQGMVARIEGNPHIDGIKGSLCARGAAGVALTMDNERPRAPMIRVGERGEGKWREVSWDEALDYTAERINALRAKYGDGAVFWSDRGGPFNDLYKGFMRGLKSPNYHNHDTACARNVHHAAQSLFGWGRKDLGYDLKNAKHVVLQTRNIFEAVNVAEVNNLFEAMDKGCKLTVLDIRATVSASKADNFFLIRPGTDYAFNLAVIHVLLTRNLYDKPFADKWIQDLPDLYDFVAPYTPQWAEMETGVPAEDIIRLAEELAEAAPMVIWHPGWMSARYHDSFQVCRTAYIINALLGSIGAKGGLAFANKAVHIGRKDLKEFIALYPEVKEPRADGAGTTLSHIDPEVGLLNLAFETAASGKPYPLKAYIAFRHDPLMAYPDPDALRALLNSLDFMVSITFTWSDTAWFSDVVLPLSPYLERDSVLGLKRGPKAAFMMRKRAMAPRFNTRADWEILSGLAKRLGADKLVFETIEDVWNYQLQDTGVTLADFEATGQAPLNSAPHYWGPDNLKFKNASNKIELRSPKLERQGLASFPPYVPPTSPPEGAFRITFGRVAVHTQGHTVNNPLLFEQMPENTLWINADKAKALGVSSGDLVEVRNGKTQGRLKAFVTDLIHPEAVFMVHGFGHDLPVESRAKGRGVADNSLMPGGLAAWDKSGGCVSMQEHFVTVRRVED